MTNPRSASIDVMRSTGTEGVPFERDTLGWLALAVTVIAGTGFGNSTRQKHAENGRRLQVWL